VLFAMKFFRMSTRFSVGRHTRSGTRSVRDTMAPRGSTVFDPTRAFGTRQCMAEKWRRLFPPSNDPIFELAGGSRSERSSSDLVRADHRKMRLVTR